MPRDVKRLLPGGIARLAEARMGRIGIVALLVALGACASGGTGWTKAGVSQDTVDSDYDSCAGEARQATRRDAGIDADILATRGQDWQRTGTLRLKEDSMAQERRVRAEDVIDRCMREKGYEPAG
jgi:hypothetical protein